MAATESQPDLRIQTVYVDEADSSDAFDYSQKETEAKNNLAWVVDQLAQMRADKATLGLRIKALAEEEVVLRRVVRAYQKNPRKNPKK